MTGFSIRITCTHFLADQRASGTLELFLEFSVEEAEYRIVIPIIVGMVVINISVINCFQKVITKAFAGFVVEIVGVETYRTCRVGLSHIFHYIGYDAEFLFGTFRVGI